MMKKGRVVAEGKPLEALTKETIQSVFGVDVEVAGKPVNPTSGRFAPLFN
jgi:ABC-type hemin transport system ATPase subunit